MTDLSADDRALLARYFPGAPDPAALDLADDAREEHVQSMLQLARLWARAEAARTLAQDSWRKGAAPRPPVYQMPPWATNDADAQPTRSGRTPGADMPQEMADVLGAELPPAPPPRRKPGTAAVVVMVAMAVALLCCGAAASEGIRWLTEGIQ